MWLRAYTSVFVLVISVHVSSCQATDSCSRETACGSCISVDPTCAWCPSHDYTGPRCVQGGYLVPPQTECEGSWVFPYPRARLKDLKLDNALAMIDRKRASFVVRPGVAVMIEVRVKIQEKHRLNGRVYTRLRIPAGIEASISSNCPQFQSRTHKSWCDVPSNSSQVGFNVTVTATRCLMKTARLRFVSSLSPRAIAKININSPCQCPCEHSPIKRSERCYGRGDEVCGMCHCDANTHGDRCECEGNFSGLQSCMDFNSTEICSGRGSCICGQCECHQLPGHPGGYYSGRFCQCDNYNCPVWEENMCGGKTRGMCQCGRCMCRAPYRGYACHIEQEPCISRNNQVCSNRGQCIAGQCRCTPPYVGLYCDQIPMNQSDVCYELKNCVLFLAFGTGPLSLIEFDEQCDRHFIMIVDRLQESSKNVCGFLDPSDGLAYAFTFKASDTTASSSYNVFVRRTKG